MPPDIMTWLWYIVILGVNELSWGGSRWKKEIARYELIGKFTRWIVVYWDVGCSSLVLLAR